jgi:hypothetical protein
MNELQHRIRYYTSRMADTNEQLVILDGLGQKS